MTEQQIKNTVDEIFQETDLLSIPVPIVDIANYYGFPVYELSMPENSSGLIISGDKIIPSINSQKAIAVNKDHSVQRRRFTIAHELAHYFLQGKPEVCYAHRDDGLYSEEERQANSFASMLLMPEDDIRRIAEKTKHTVPKWQLSEELIDAVRWSFNVSAKAAEVRLKKLKLL